MKHHPASYLQKLSAMARLHFHWLFCLCFLIFVSTLSGKTSAADEERKVYIVYMGALPEREYSPSSHHRIMLRETVETEFPEKHLIRSYTKSFNGFAANLTEQEQQKLAAKEEIVSIFPSRNLELHTTESWDFTGFPLDVNRSLSVETEVIIGVIDTGLWPESESFNDDGFGPVPKKWKGVCHGGKNFTCNKKIIGVRHYDVDDSARDYIGHGSHTASTAAGNIVKNVSFYGIAGGTARGAVPSARIAMYKVCSPLGCSDEDILAAFDDAIADGVDLLTISIGRPSPLFLAFDTIAIGAFHAAEKGILTVNSAGNNSGKPGQTSSVAPWLFSVAASSTKRRIISKVVLGDGKKIAGLAVNSFKLNGTSFPLVYGRDASETCEEPDAGGCSLGCLDSKKVKGKIVICGHEAGIGEASSVGAVATIALTDAFYDVSDVFPSPASILSHEQFKQLMDYYHNTKNPEATIYPSESGENTIFPAVASFSSRGPNQVFPDILKPDITAPGVDILAAYSPAAPPSDADLRSVNYNVISGTSMACPHVAGVAAYLKSWHPDWSPSAIKSALMTTAWRLNTTNAKHGDAEFSYGAGHIDPIKALNPGLVYETLKEDYVKLLCSMKYNKTTLRNIFGNNATCPKAHLKSKDLNYPSMSAQVNRSEFLVKFPRKVTNVGLANSTYKATVTGPPECNITVHPSVLSFKAFKERQSFVVTVTGRVEKNMSSASLEWSDGVHSVRSPIVLHL